MIIKNDIFILLHSYSCINSSGGMNIWSWNDQFDGMKNECLSGQMKWSLDTIYTGFLCALMINKAQQIFHFFYYPIPLVNLEIFI